MGWILRQKTIDPVCGKRMIRTQSEIAAVHEGHAFYFCSRQCWSAFQDAPSDYMTGTSAEPKGWWGRYLKRVEKTTGGKPPCCH